jgi:respiratory burst oxidase
MQTIAVAIVIGILVHAGTHLSCDFVRVIYASEDKFQRYVADDFNYKRPTYMQIVLSVEGVSGIAMVVLMTIAFVLASRWFRKNLVKLPWPLHRLTGFNAFWYSHHLFVVVYILLIVHSVFLYLSHEWYQKTVSNNE